MQPRKAKLLSASLLASLAASALAGCSPSRSVEAYCSTMEKYKTSYLEQMDVAQESGDLSGLTQAVGAIGDLKLMWSDMASVAPDEIRTDTEAVRDAWKKQEDAGVDNDVLSGLMIGLLNTGPMSRVDTYVKEHCDGISTDVAVESSETSEPEPEQEIESEPAIETQVAALEPDDAVTGAEAVIDTSTSVLYTATSSTPVTITPHVDPGELAGDMKYGVESFPGSPVTVAIVGEITTLQDGLTPASDELVLQTFSHTGQLITDVAIDPSTYGPGIPLTSTNDVKVANGAVIVALGGHDAKTDTTVSIIAGIDPNTGQMLWTTEVPTGQGKCNGVNSGEGKFDAPGTLTDKGLYVYGTPDTIIALDSTTGTQAWANKLGPSCNYYIDTLNPISSRYLVIKSNGNKTAILDASSGATVRADVESSGFDPLTGDLALSFMHHSTSVSVNEGHPAMEVLDSSGNVVFTLTAEQGMMLGGLEINAAFDGRIWIDTPNAIEVIFANDGTRDDNADPYLDRTVIAGNHTWSLVGDENSATLILHPGRKADVSTIQTHPLPGG